MIYNAISKTLLYHCKDREKPRLHLLGPTDISAVNIGENTHFGLGIKPVIKRPCLYTESKGTVRNRLSELSVMTIAELLRLPPVRGKLIFSQFYDKDSIKHLLGLQL